MTSSHTSHPGTSRQRKPLLLDEDLGYTLGMKTAVSIPDDVFERAERLAARTKRSRSRIFSDALREYLARHSSDEITSAIDRACSEIGSLQDPFTSAAAQKILDKSEW